jgi:hypothetical protein
MSQDSIPYETAAHCQTPTQAGSSLSKLVGATKKKAISELELSRGAIFYPNKPEAAMNVEANISPAQ